MPLELMLNSVDESSCAFYFRWKFCNDLDKIENPVECSFQYYFFCFSVFGVLLIETDIGLNFIMRYFEKFSKNISDDARCLTV